MGRIISAIGAFFVAIFGAWLFGRKAGTEKAKEQEHKKEVERQQKQINKASEVANAQRDIIDDIHRGDSVERLRDKYTRD